MDPTDVSVGHPDRGRYSARRKTQTVIRLLRGEDIGALSREMGVTAATVSGWRDHFVAGGQAAYARDVPPPPEGCARRNQVWLTRL